MELRYYSAVSYGNLLSIYRRGRKVNHLGGNLRHCIAAAWASDTKYSVDIISAVT
jgi:hypothetical protein